MKKTDLITLIIVAAVGFRGLNEPRPRAWDERETAHHGGHNN